MIDCNLGPDFKSCFLGHKQSEYGKTFTVRLAKHMCYEDARLVQHFVNQKAMRQWIDAVTDFCEGNNVLRDCLIGMTACYVDYFQRAWNEICQGNYAAADQKAGKHPERNLCS